MSFTLVASNLRSRAARRQVGGNGTRIFRNTGAALAEEGGGFWSSAGKFIAGVFGGAIKLLFSGISITFTALWEFVVNATTQVYNFDWNVGDAELQKAVVDNFNSLGSQFGTFAGAAAGWLTCGALPGAIIAYFNEPLGNLVLQNVGEAALDEMTSNLASLLTSIVEYLGKAAFSYLYQNARNLYRGTDLEFRTKLIERGVKLEDVEKAATERNKPYIFSQKVEEKISKVDNEFAKNFLSSFLEQFGESCIEAGYVVAGSVDDYMARQRLSRSPLFGSEETLEVTIDDNDQTRIVRSPTATRYEIERT